MSLQANSSGVVTGKFTIPANVPTGAKSVVFNGGGGSHGEATFIGQGSTVIDTKQLVTTTTTQRYDPLAQTFMVTTAQQIFGVDLWFTAKAPTPSPVVVQIREVTAGFPTQTVLAEARLLTTNLNVGGSPTRFTLDRTVRLAANTEYALVVLCDDAVTACSIAELGKWDSVNGKWVTAQPYQVGVLLSSSNASTWTAHQDRDLTFRLIKAKFSSTSKTVALGSVAVVDATDLIVRASVENPTSLTGCIFQLTLPDSSVMLVAAEQPVRLDTSITGDVQIAAILNGTANDSPVLHRDIYLLHATVATSADYVTRAIPGGTNVTAKVILEALLPGSSSVSVQVKGVDAGDTWTTLNNPTTLVMDDGWVEMTFTSGSMTEDMIQAKLILGGSVVFRPQVRNLRMLVL